MRPIQFDEYTPESLKSNAIQQRVVGIRTKVLQTGKMPKEWNSFLRNDSNKKGLYSLLPESIYQIQNGIA